MDRRATRPGWPPGRRRAGAPWWGAAIRFRGVKTRQRFAVPRSAPRFDFGGGENSTAIGRAPMGAAFSGPGPENSTVIRRARMGAAFSSPGPDNSTVIRRAPMGAAFSPPPAPIRSPAEHHSRAAAAASRPRDHFPSPPRRLRSARRRRRRARLRSARRRRRRTRPCSSPAPYRPRALSAAARYSPTCSTSIGAKARGGRRPSKTMSRSSGSWSKKS